MTTARPESATAECHRLEVEPQVLASILDHAKRVRPRARGFLLGTVAQNGAFVRVKVQWFQPNTPNVTKAHAVILNQRLRMQRELHGKHLQIVGWYAIGDGQPINVEGSAQPQPYEVWAREFAIARQKISFAFLNILTAWNINNNNNNNSNNPQRLNITAKVLVPTEHFVRQEKGEDGQIKDITRRSVEECDAKFECLPEALSDAGSIVLESIMRQVLPDVNEAYQKSEPLSIDYQILHIKESHEQAAQQQQQGASASQLPPVPSNAAPLLAEKLDVVTKALNDGASKANLPAAHAEFVAKYKALKDVKARLKQEFEQDTTQDVMLVKYIAGLIRQQVLSLEDLGKAQQKSAQQQQQ